MPSLPWLGSFRQRKSKVWVLYTWNPNELIFWRPTPQNKALSNQNKGHLGSRYWLSNDSHFWPRYVWWRLNLWLDRSYIYSRYQCNNWNDIPFASNRPTFPSFNTHIVQCCGGIEYRNDNTNHWVRTEDEWRNRHERSSYSDTRRDFFQGDVHLFLSPFPASGYPFPDSLVLVSGVPSARVSTMLLLLMTMCVYLYAIWHDWWGLWLEKTECRFDPCG